MPDYEEKKKAMRDQAAQRLKDAGGHATSDPSSMYGSSNVTYAYPESEDGPAVTVTLPDNKSSIDFDLVERPGGASAVRQSLGHEFTAKPEHVTDFRAVRELDAYGRKQAEKLRSVQDADVKAKAHELMLADLRRRMDDLSISYPSDETNLYSLSSHIRQSIARDPERAYAPGVLPAGATYKLSKEN